MFSESVVLVMFFLIFYFGKTKMAFIGFQYKKKKLFCSLLSIIVNNKAIIGCCETQYCPAEPHLIPCWSASSAELGHATLRNCFYWIFFLTGTPCARYRHHCSWRGRECSSWDSEHATGHIVRLDTIGYLFMFVTDWGNANLPIPVRRS